ncbi:MAG: hypothetical protein VX694_16355 [Planctomycetota bacterium]|nr:hypothetical protein [Planctomycetota bacterium]
MNKDQKPIKNSLPEQTNRDLSSKRGDRRALSLALLLGVIVIAGGVSVVAYWPDNATEQEELLTHEIRRGRLVVSVTEQGTLESSNNTEIKCKVRGFSTVTYVVPTGTVVEEGQELVRLDTKVLEEQYSLTKTNTFIAQATLAETKANVETAEIAIKAYEEGRYRSELQQLENELAVNQEALRTSRENYERSKTLFRQGFATELEVEGNAIAVTQAELQLQVKETEINVLKNYTRRKEMETMNGNLTASRSKLAADEAGLAMEIKRRDRAKQELEDCVIRAEKSGLVIYPSAAAWKTTPDITDGATVRKDQVLLLMPDLSQMQVKLGIHESVIDRVSPGLEAVVTLPDRTLTAKVTEVASVTRPAGWWTGNVVKYDTIIELPQDSGLKPGMSAEIEVVLAVHDSVLMLPVAAVIETEEGAFCWVSGATGNVKRSVVLGDSNDVFVEVMSGLTEGEKVILNPAALLDEAAEDALQTFGSETSSPPGQSAAQEVSQP